MNRIVTIPFNKGEIAGLSCIGYRSVQYYSFQGIPYAQPPVGDLRFKAIINKAPVPITEWDEVLDATQERPQCYQRHMIRFDEVDGSEDCLYLNVYTTK
ncbi:hypothetical protein FQR65_LT09440 [Abscondita terminalis]|nr:hypothetical protein FQR65_LT09440 [Abscondita terminalis]